MAATCKVFIVLFLLGFLAPDLSAQLQANFTASPTSGCAPIRAVFTDVSTGSPTAWKWDLGNGTISFLPNPSVTYFSAGVYTVKLTVYNGNDSSTVTKSNFITVYDNPVANFDANPKTGCYPLRVGFQDLSLAGAGSTISTWQWDYGDGNISNLPNSNHIYTATGLFNVSLTVVNNNGCRNTLTRPNLIVISQGVHADFTNTVPPLCQVPATVTFTNLSTGAGSNTCFWDFGDNSTSSVSSPVHVYANAGTFTVKLIVINSSGCSDTIIKTNQVNVGVIHAAFSNPDTVCVNTPVLFINNSTPRAALTGSRWDFGDGSFSSGFNPIKSFITAGNFTVKLISSFGLCQDSATKMIVVLPKPNAAFTGTSLSACRAPLTANFTNTSTGGTVVKWYFGDGDSSTQNNPAHLYQAGGLFTVTLIIRNASGCTDTLRKPGFVNISPPKITFITPLPVNGCVPYPVNFQPVITTVDPIVTYEWDFGDGTLSTQPNPQHTYSVEEIYTVKLKVTSANGCVDSILLTRAVVVGNKPVAAFIAIPRNTCAMIPVSFTDTSANGPDEWHWDFGDSTTSTEQNPIHYYHDTGFFNITLIVSRNGCADTLRRPNYIYIKPPISAFLDSFICTNQYQHFFRDRSVGALYYKYRFGDGDSSNLPSPVHMYADTGRYLVTQRVSDSSCFHESSRVVLVLNEKAGFNVTDSIGCKSTVKQFDATAHSWNIKTYQWNFGDGNSYTDTSGTQVRHRYNSTGSYPVMLHITDLNNCPDSLTKPVPVSLYGPKAGFGPFQKVCKNTPVTFADSSFADAVNSIVEWTWDFGDTTGRQVFSAPPFTHTYTQAGFYSVKLIVKDASGCTDSILKVSNVKVNEVSAAFLSPDTVKCSNTPVRFLFNGAGTINAFAWNFGDGVTSTVASPLHAYAGNGFYDVKLKVIDEVGCIDSITKPQYIRIVDASAAFSMSDSFTTCPPLFVLLSNQSVNAAQINWNFGDGNTSTLLNPSHTYTFSGVFNVQLMVTGNGGCKDSVTRQIKILGPTGNLVYNPVVGCAPLQVQFTSSSVNTSFYTWDYNDGNTNFASDTTATHTYPNWGTYLPRIILEDSLGCKLPILGPDSIRVKGIKTRIRGLASYLICDSLDVQFTDSTETNDLIRSWSWVFGDGTFSNIRHPLHHYNRSGLYQVSLRVTTVTGCTSSDTLGIPVKVVPSPITTIDGDTTGCIPKTLLFRGQWLNQDSAVLRWKWDFGNGQVSQLQNPPAQTYTLPGTYQIRSIAINGSGCADTTDKQLVVFPLPVVDAGPGAFICKGGSCTLSASGATSYAWDAQASLACMNCRNPVATPDTNTSYRVVGTDINGCKNADTVSVRVKQPFLMRVNPGDTLCDGQTFRLGAFGAEKYAWSPVTYLNNSTIANPVTTPATSVNYRVVGYDSLNCFRDTGYVVVKVYPLPTVNIIEDIIRLGAGNSVQLHSTASADVTRWRWTPPIGLSCTDCATPIATPKLETTYVLRVTNAGNCVAEDKVRVIMICNGSNIFIPNTFSPNGDGANDVFYPRGKGLFGIKSLRIFDRWGELVFEKTNFQPNDVSVAWDGTYKSKMLTPDVYVYVLEAICDNNELFTMKGNVTLLR